MEAQIWTLIGILTGVIVAAFGYLGSRIDDLGGRIDGLQGEVNARIDGLGARTDGLHGWMDALEQNLRAEITAQGRELGERIYELGVKLDDHLRRHAG